MAQSQSPLSSPPLEGYNSAHEEVLASSGEETTVPTQQKRRKTLRKPTKRPPSQSATRHSARDAGGRFRSTRNRQSGGTDSEIGSAADLLSVDSLTWDAHTQPLNATVGTRRWSVETQYGVPIDPTAGLERLSPHAEGRESAASGWIEQLHDTMADLERVRDSVDRALIEIEDDVLPFWGKNLTSERLDELTAKAGRLKRALQDGHLYLVANDEEYETGVKGLVVENRRALSEFIVELEEVKAGRQAAAAEAARADNRMADAEKVRLGARQEVVKGEWPCYKVR